MLIRNFDAVFLSDLGEYKPEPHPALGNAAIFLPRFFLGGSLVGKGTALLLEIVLDCRPDVFELLFQQGGRRIEFVTGVKLVQQGALDLLPRGRPMLALETLANRVAELGER